MDIEKIKGKRQPIQKLREAEDICFTRKEIANICDCGKSMSRRLVERGKLMQEKLLMDGRRKNIYFFPEDENKIREIING